ncbi:transport protein TonB [Aliarcobacter thereius]|uniref:Transport protein TonB n=1 Tax=Aliarcobacter thereius TaxID=544718 RepID=A0A1C0B606_9BACT|nr:energy transducer TonB [Aliarcobacter thereius]OCL98594.1 transport protein TonB [Aliarcobacter thereius]TLT06184.1 energy transducer TonB [Aliarcobacter thereius]
MKNNRYLKSFLISFSIYFVIAAPLVISLANTTKTVDMKKDVHTVTKISLSSVEVQKKPVEEEVVEEEIIEKVIEKPAQKVVKKEVKKPKKEKPKKKPEKKVVQKEEVIKDKVITQDTVNQVKAAEMEDMYLGKIKHIIEKNKKYPRVAKRLKHEGKVTISFDILADGKIVNIRIIENSKYKTLDQATMELLANIAFFDAIPKELNKTVWNNIQVPVNYEMH